MPLGLLQRKNRRIRGGGLGTREVEKNKKEVCDGGFSLMGRIQDLIDQGREDEKGGVYERVPQRGKAGSLLRLVQVSFFPFVSCLREKDEQTSLQALDADMSVRGMYTLGMRVPVSVWGDVLSSLWRGGCFFLLLLD